MHERLQYNVNFLLTNSITILLLMSHIASCTHKHTLEMLHLFSDIDNYLENWASEVSIKILNHNNPTTGRKVY